jgi:serine/threonine-protein kinase
MDSVRSESVNGQPDAVRRAGGYDLLEAIGSGGMSHVYRARHGRTGEIVAAKVLHIDDVAPDVERRLRREPELHQGIGHDNIVRLIEWFRVEDEFFLIMEFVAGESLAQILHRRGHPFSLDEVTGYFRQLLGGVGHLHELGIIHRDIKPANILLRHDGVVKLADFGIAKFAWQQEGTRNHLCIGNPG